MQSPLIRAAKRNTKRENNLISYGCGIVFAALVLAFIIKATN